MNKPPCFQLVVVAPSMSRPGAFRLLAGSPFSLSRCRVRLSLMVADRQPQQLDGGRVGGEVATVLG